MEIGRRNFYHRWKIWKVSTLAKSCSQQISQTLHALDISHTMIDLILQSAQNPSANTSPSTPSSPSPHLSSRHQHLSHANTQPPPSPYNADQLIRLKIVMRETEHPTRPRQPLGSADPSALYGGDDNQLLGRNEGTVRFLFGPPTGGVIEGL